MDIVNHLLSAIVAEIILDRIKRLGAWLRRRPVVIEVIWIIRIRYRPVPDEQPHAV